MLNVGRAHAGEFGSIDAVAKAKGELVEALPARRGRRGGTQRRRPQRRRDGRPHQGPRGHHERGHPTATPTCGRPASPSMTWAAPRSRCTRGRAAAPVTLTLHGGHHVANALAAAAVAAELGMDVAAIADALTAATARSKKRMELHERADGVLVVNDAYNANPDSTRAAIEALGAPHEQRQARASPSSATWRSSATSPPRATRRRAGSPRRPARRSSSPSGPAPRPVLDGARATGGWQGEAIAVPDPERRRGGAAKPFAPRRRSTSEGIEVRRPVGSRGRPARGG